LELLRALNIFLKLLFCIGKRWLSLRMDESGCGCEQRETN
jgi:hypothetical protein